MTLETKLVIDPEDVLAIRFECAKCHASTSVPIKSGLAEYATNTAASACRFCHAPWDITPNSAEHKALLQFALGLEGIAANMQGRTLKLKLEIKGPVHP
jgi:hypothetical protein